MLSLLYSQGVHLGRNRLFPSQIPVLLLFHQYHRQSPWSQPHQGSVPVVPLNFWPHMDFEKSGCPGTEAQPCFWHQGCTVLLPWLVFMPWAGQELHWGQTSQRSRVSRRTTCTSRIKVQAWVERLESVTSGWRGVLCTVSVTPPTRALGGHFSRCVMVQVWLQSWSCHPRAEGRASGSLLAACLWCLQRNLGRLPTSKGCPAFLFGVCYFSPLCYDSGGKDWSFQRITHIMQ